AADAGIGPPLCDPRRAGVLRDGDALCCGSTNDAETAFRSSSDGAARVTAAHRVDQAEPLRGFVDSWLGRSGPPLSAFSTQCLLLGRTVSGLVDLNAALLGLQRQIGRTTCRPRSP